MNQNPIKVDQKKKKTYSLEFKLESGDLVQSLHIASIKKRHKELCQMKVATISQ